MQFSKIRGPLLQQNTLSFLKKGDDSGGDTPLPIPNREVKPASADGTARETSWESRSSPISCSYWAPGPCRLLRMLELSNDTLVVFVSDTHIGGDPGCDGFESPGELEALFEELGRRDGPVELILAGDFFDFLQIGRVEEGKDRATLTIERPEYESLFAALKRFGEAEGKRVIYLPGN